MNLNLSLVLGDLSENQRMALAAMIMDAPVNLPAADEPSVCSTRSIAVTADTSKAIASIDALAAHVVATVPPELANEIAYLVKEGGEFDASVAFGAGTQHDPAAAFGGTPAPLPPGATLAPFTAVAVPPSTVPVATPILTNPANGPIPLAQNPAPVGAAHSAPVVALSPANGVELDKNGLPWDARIHGSTKTKNSDGTWRAKRGVDNAMVLQVNNQLRQLMGAVTPLAQAPATATTLAPLAGHVTMPTAGAAFSGVPAPASGLNLVAPPPPSHSAPALGAVSNITAAPSVALPDGRQLFVALIGRASAALQANKLTQAEVAEICTRHGVPALPLLANRLDLVPTIAAEIDALIATRP